MKTKSPIKSCHLTPPSLAAILGFACLFTAFQARSTDCVPPPAGLVSWWQGEGNADDSVGTNNGTLVGGASFASGQVGQSFALDGISGWVLVPDSAALNPSGPFSVEVWVKANPVQAGQFLIVDKSHGFVAPASGWLLQGNANGTVSFGFGNGGPDPGAGGFPVANTVSSVLDNQWHHLAGVYTGNLEIYFDGVREDTVAPNALPAGNNRAVEIGRSWGGGAPTRFFSGLIDEVSFYNRALSQSEVAAICAAGSAGKCGLPPALTLQPTNQFVLAGSNVLFAVAATGTQPLSYQWALNETNLPGETTNTLNLSNVSSLNAGFYTVVVTNVIGSITSTPALLDVRYSLAYGNGGLMLGSNYTFIGSVALQLWSVFPNANFFYTLDGSEPSFESDYYAGPFNLNHTATLRVIAYSADFFQAAESPPIYLTVIPTYALNFISSGGGTVTANPPASPYVSGTVVTLTAQPSNGWTFLEWRGDASGANPTFDVTMQRALNVQAVFGTTLGTTVAGNGAVDVYPALSLYPYGTVARLTAIPQAGSYFAVWGNAASGNTNPLYFTVTSAAPTVSSLFATLSANHHSLTVIPDGFGRVAITPRANAYSTGASVSLNAIPDPGQQFLTWSGDATGTENPLSISINASKTITATFTRKPSFVVDSPFGGLFEDGFRFTLIGEFGGEYSIWGSTNLVDWLPVGIVTNTYGTAQFTDPAGTNLPGRFYRATEP